MRKRLRPTAPWALLLGAALLPGCATVSSSTALPEAVRATVPPLAAGEIPRVVAPSDEPEVLVLSSGGMNGAFTAGFLSGWTEAGTRPHFDVVTGVSVGALIAPFAFLGPEYDADLERISTSMGAAGIFRMRPLFTLPFVDALADSTPLRRLIEREVTEDLLDRVAREHLRGRRLYIGTTNLEAQQFVIWDLGAIAASDEPRRLQLFRDTMLASCSIPGLLPPVPFDVEIDGRPHSELHADGAVTASLFLLPPMLGIDPSSSNAFGLDFDGDGHVPGAGNVSVIVAGKLRAEAAPVRGRFLQVSGASLSGLLQAQRMSDLQRVNLMARRAGARFRLAAIPEEVRLEQNPMSGGPRTMQALFETGREAARSGHPWIDRAPGLSPPEWPTPRTGVSLPAPDSVDPTPKWPLLPDRWPARRAAPGPSAIAPRDPGSELVG